MANYTTYSAGFVRVTNSSPIVTGSGTTWSAANGVFPGDKITIDGVDYRILTRDSTTQITLTENYAGATDQTGTLTYLVSDKFDPPALTANEAVTINNGVTVTITSSAWSALGMGNLTLTWGTLKFLNSSTSTGVKLLLSSSTTSLSGTGRSLFATQGGWKEIGVGTGLAGQKVTHWDSDFCPCVWVEDGEGTGNYEKYMNLTGCSAAHTIADFTNFSDGDFGKVFTQNKGTVTTVSGNAAVTGTNTTFTDLTVGHKISIGTATYTIASITDDTHLTISPAASASLTNTALWLSTVLYFSTNGTNGKPPPANAKIRVPNIVLTHLGAISTYPVNLPLGNFNVSLDTTQLSRLVPAASSGSKAVAEFRRCSIPHQFSCSGAQAPYFEDCGWGIYNSETNSCLNFSGGFSYTRGAKLVNCSMWGAGTGTSSPIALDLVDLTLIDCEVLSVSDTGTNTNTVIYATVATDLTIQGGRIAGMIQTQGGLHVDGVTHVNVPTLVEGHSASTSKHAYYLGNLTAVRNVEIKNVTVPVGGGFYGCFVFLGGSPSNILLSGIRSYSTRFQYVLNGSSTNPTGLYIRDCDFAGVTAQVLGASLYCYDLQIQNLRCASAPQGWVSTIQGNSSYSSIRAARNFNATVSNNSEKSDFHFYDFATGDTVGVLGIICTTVKRYANYVTLTGGATFDGGKVYIATPGDSATFEFPYRILGITSFQNVAPSVVGYLPPTAQYQIKTSGDWSVWKDLTAEIISGETVSATDGFNIRFKVTGAQAGAYVNGIQIATNVDQSVLYPTASADLTLIGLKPQSEVRVYRSSDGVDFCPGVDESDASGVYSYTYNYFGSPILVDVVVHHLNYQYIRYEGLELGENGLTLPIQQQRDRNYLNP